MADVEFYGENKRGTRFVPQQPQQWQGQADSRGLAGLVMRWLGIKNEAAANYILIGLAIVFFIAAAVVFMRI